MWWISARWTDRSYAFTFTQSDVFTLSAGLKTDKNTSHNQFSQATIVQSSLLGRPELNIFGDGDRVTSEHGATTQPQATPELKSNIQYKNNIKKDEQEGDRKKEEKKEKKEKP